MAKSSSDKTKSKPAQERSYWWVHVLAVVALVAGVGALARASKNYIDAKVDKQTAPPAVVFKDRPAWMSDVLFTQITSTIAPTSARSTFDHQLLVETVEKLRSNPWISAVRDRSTRPEDSSCTISAHTLRIWSISHLPRSKPRMSTAVTCPWFTLASIPCFSETSFAATKESSWRTRSA